MSGRSRGDGRRKLNNRTLIKEECTSMALKEKDERDKLGKVEECVALKEKDKRKELGWLVETTLATWYKKGIQLADQLLPQMQINANLQHVSLIHCWKVLKPIKEGYIMLRGLQTRKETPVILFLDHEYLRCGGLTYYSLHAQIRRHLDLPELSPLRPCRHWLRICPYRPWYDFCITRSPIPECYELPRGTDSMDSQCRHLLGTTLLHDDTDTYVHPDKKLHSDCDPDSDCALRCMTLPSELPGVVTLRDCVCLPCEQPPADMPMEVHCMQSIYNVKNFPCKSIPLFIENFQ